MPWSIIRRSGKFCVKKGGSGQKGEILKCYDSREEALKYQRALYHGESDKPSTKQMAASVSFTDEAEALLPEIGPAPTISIRACGGPANPPADWFTEPPEDAQHRYITITSEGRVMGMLAQAGECHIGYPDMCVSPPVEEDGFPYFHVGRVETADGTLASVGPVTLRGGHANPQLDASTAQKHYDDTDNAIMDVAVGSNSKGIWFSGALRPDATEEEVRRLRASGVSGDWRRIDGQLRLIGFCSVNTPGFPKVHIAADADELVVASLIGAGGEPEPVITDDCPCCDDVETELTEAERVAFDALSDRVLATFPEP